MQENPVFKSNTLNPGVKKRIWKSLKQIVILDKAEINCKFVLLSSEQNINEVFKPF